MVNKYVMVRPGVWTIVSAAPVRPVLVNGCVPSWDDEPLDEVPSW